MIIWKGYEQALTPVAWPLNAAKETLNGEEVAKVPRPVERRENREEKREGKKEREGGRGRERERGKERERESVCVIMCV